MFHETITLQVVAGPGWLLYCSYKRLSIVLLFILNEVIVTALVDPL